MKTVCTSLTQACLIFFSLVLLSSISYAENSQTITEPTIPLSLEQQAKQMDAALMASESVIPPTYELYISQLGKIGKDLKILQLQQKGYYQQFANFGGDFEVLYNNTSNEDYAFDPSLNQKQTESSLSVINVRFYFLFNLNKWTHIEATYRANTTTLQDGYVIFGDLDQSPYYTTIGKQYIPFGNFRKLSVSTNPLTKTIFRMNGNAITFGRYKHNMNTLLSFYLAKDNSLAFAAQNNFDISLPYFKGQIGVGFASDLSDMTTAFEYIIPNNTKRLPTLDAFAQWKTWPFLFKSEIDQVVTPVQNNQYMGAFDLEGQYGFKVKKLPLAVSFAYSQAYNAGELFDNTTYETISLPKKQWVASIKSQILSHTFLGASYTRAKTYQNAYFNVINIDLTLKY